MVVIDNRGNAISTWPVYWQNRMDIYDSIDFYERSDFIISRLHLGAIFLYELSLIF